MQVSEQLLFVPAADGTRLAITLYRPEGDGPFATLLEALPYRMDDVTSSYADGYQRFAGEGGFAVVRMDLRGTGNSAGVLGDEYPDIERSDLRDVIEWVAAQPWSNGKVGMLGTSYSGFNSLHMAMEPDLPALAAVCAMYATDDRYTDDVHYMGGALRALDLIDYPLYMIAMNALPPTPSVWDANSDTGWVDEWRRRIDQNEPWLLEWLRHPLPDQMWRRGSVRTGPDGAGYDRFTCPVFLIAGWADGYRNNTFRTLQHSPGTRLLAGPWVHKAPATAVPGPNVDDDLEIMRFFHQHLRGGEPVHEHLVHLFVREPSPPEPDLLRMNGTWVQADEWPPYAVEDLLFVGAGTSVDTLPVRGDVGVAAWNSCAGGLPWGQPLDQRHDNAMSIVHDFAIEDGCIVVGNADVRLQVKSSAPVGHVSVKLCDVAPDGTSVLITRGFLDLTHRGVWPSDAWGAVGASPTPLTPGAWMDVRVEFEATTWTLVPGHSLRLAIAGTDWPNCWPPAEPFTLSVRRDSVRLTLPATRALPALTDELVSTPGRESLSHEGVEWRHEHDVLARETRVHTLYGERYDGAHGTVVTDHYEGHLGISTVDLSKAWAKGDSHYTMEFPEGTCFVQATLDMHSDATAFHVTIELTATLNGAPFAHRTWTDTLPR